MKNAFNGLISILHISEEGISELEDISKESFKTKKQKEQRQKKKRIFKGQLQKSIMYM